MSTITPTRFFTGLLTNALVTQYTAPGATRAVIKRIAVANVSGSSHAVTMQITPSGGSAYTITFSFPIAAGATVVIPEFANTVLQPGDSIQAEADAINVLNISCSGFTVV